MGDASEAVSSTVDGEVIGETDVPVTVDEKLITQDDMTVEQMFDALNRVPLRYLANKDEISVYMNCESVNGHAWKLILEAAYEHRRIPKYHVMIKKIENINNGMKSHSDHLIDHLEEQNFTVGEFYQICKATIPTRRNIIDLIENSVSETMEKWETQQKMLRDEKERLDSAGKFVCAICRCPIYNLENTPVFSCKCLNQLTALRIGPSVCSPGGMPVSPPIGTYPSFGSVLQHNLTVCENNNDVYVRDGNNVSYPQPSADQLRTISGVSLVVNTSDRESLSSASDSPLSNRSSLGDSYLGDSRASFDQVLCREAFNCLATGYQAHCPNGNESTAFNRQGSYPGSNGGNRPVQNCFQKRRSDGGIQVGQWERQVMNRTEINGNSIRVSALQVTFVPVMKPVELVRKCIEQYNFLRQRGDFEQCHFHWPNPQKSSDELLRNINCANVIVFCIPENIGAFSMYYKPGLVDDNELLQKNRTIQYIVQYIYRNARDLARRVVLLTLPGASVPALAAEPLRACRAFKMDGDMNKLVGHMKKMFGQVAIEKREMGKN
ncbi:uncharacterized protein LOC141912983 [Tubulanus polymorphus]|uniref:uncharacterized protein LOC141912983 n=1 Tax=Tubulanus polymorphus TaxID=672921 RepID=UPI003DA6AA15